MLRPLKSAALSLVLLMVSTISTSILAAGLHHLQRRTPPPPPPAAAGHRPAEYRAGHQVQRHGEWSPICARTGQPLVDFGPVDAGAGRRQLMLVVHNCSDRPVSIGRPSLSQSEPTPLAHAYSGRGTTRLAPGASATAMLQWTATPDPEPHSNQLTVRVAGIGEGVLTDDALQLGPGSRVTLTGWTA